MKSLLFKIAPGLLVALAALLIVGNSKAQNPTAAPVQAIQYAAPQYAAPAYQPAPLPPGYAYAQGAGGALIIVQVYEDAPRVLVTRARSSGSFYGIPPVGFQTRRAAYYDDDCEIYDAPRPESVFIGDAWRAPVRRRHVESARRFDDGRNHWRD